MASHVGQFVHPRVAQQWGVFGWNYNRGNYKFDQGLRWQRFTAGRKMACAQVGMFRQDVSDLAGVSMAKMKVYGPIYGIVITVCVTVFVEGRSGLKFPGPPVFISSIYLQCLGIGMAFMALATWLLFHASMRAQLACIQLRTRVVRLPVPTQKQLDSSRKILSTWEEQGLYDMFRIPFVMPNGADSPEGSDDEEAEEASPTRGAGYKKGGMPGVAAKVKSKLKDAHERGATKGNARMPGLTPGNPSWYNAELEAREENPQMSPSGFGKDGPEEPYQHFELLRAAQKDWWGCEAYMRVCFLFGMMHLVMAFSYWITLHNICELGMIWCSNLGAAGLTAGVWIIFRLDVLPEHGGCFPWEIGGPFVTSIALGLMYSHTYTQTMMDIARGVAAGIIIMHILLTFRLYSVAKPSFGKAHHRAKESGGRLFNESASCDAPSWLPAAFQPVMYLVAPPKTADQLEQEERDRDNNALGDDPLAKVDMTPWRYVRIMIFAVGLGWFIQLGGHACECIMGERMLTSNPGMPPWSRTGQWYGWEHGPVSSKHYAHVTPQRGHWAWQKGWGPQGQQELWASDMFGFHPEADAWWAEPEGPEPLVGAAGFGENTWNKGVIAYGQNEPSWGAHVESPHDWDNSGGHRRLSTDAFGNIFDLDQASFPVAARASPLPPPRASPRPVVPLPVAWPESLEPDFIACAPEASGRSVAAITASGIGALLSDATAAFSGGAAEGGVATFVLEGLLELGLARSVTWRSSDLLAVTGSGLLASCPRPEASSSSPSSSLLCDAFAAPPLPGFTDGALSSSTAAAALAHEGGEVRVAVSSGGGRVVLFELQGMEWAEVASVEVPTLDAEVIGISASPGRLLVTAADGSAFHWELRGGLPASKHPKHDLPAASSSSRRSWQSACMLGGEKVIRLASSWQRSRGGDQTLRPELLL